MVQVRDIFYEKAESEGEEDGPVTATLVWGTVNRKAGKSGCHLVDFGGPEVAGHDLVLCGPSRQVKVHGPVYARGRRGVGIHVRGRGQSAPGIVKEVGEDNELMSILVQVTAATRENETIGDIAKRCEKNVQDVIDLTFYFIPSNFADRDGNAARRPNTQTKAQCKKGALVVVGFRPKLE